MREVFRTEALEECPRCGEPHEAVELRRLTNPCTVAVVSTADGQELRNPVTHLCAWGTCPTLGEPVVMLAHYARYTNARVVTEPSADRCLKARGGVACALVDGHDGECGWPTKEGGL